jgi:hypothetical protein
LSSMESNTMWIKRIFREHYLRNAFRQRLGEPLHLNFVRSFVSLFGGVRQKIEWDVFERRSYAFGILLAADWAAEHGVGRIAALEFGVASGVGLRSMAKIAAAVSQLTGVAIDVYGFDTGKGMPAAQDYRDHPEYYYEGDFKSNVDEVRKSLPGNASLVIGNIAETGPALISGYEGKIGFAAIDVDYYSSAQACLRIFTGAPERYLPLVPVVFDDVLLDFHNPWCGELLAISEFNEANKYRKIAPFRALNQKRIMKRASWIDQTYALHVLDHPMRAVSRNRPVSPRVM